MVDFLFASVQVLVLFFQIYETADQLFNTVSLIVILLLLSIGLYHIDEEVSVLLCLDELCLSLCKFDLLCLDVGGELLNGLLVSECILLQFLQFLILLFSLGLVVDDLLLVCCDAVQYLLLLNEELLLLFIKLLSLSNNGLLPLSEFIVDFPLLSLLLQQADSL